MDLADKLKMALDEGRLLILGAQVVFGCQFQMVFQERFQDAPRESPAVRESACWRLCSLSHY